MSSPVAPLESTPEARHRRAQAQVFEDRIGVFSECGVERGELNALRKRCGGHGISLVDRCVLRDPPEAYRRKI